MDNIKTDKRLRKLKIASKTYEDFVRGVLSWTKYYLSPDKLRWTKEDLRRYYYDNGI